jgi:phosphohistidine phosphatase
LLRHGEAEPHEAREDMARRLTERGERQATTAGKALVRLGIEIGPSYASPRVRSLDTAKLACAELGCEPEVREFLSAGFDRDDALALMAEHDADARVLVVGHEPDFSQVVHDLTGARIDLKKGGVAGVRLDGTRAELIVLLRPKDLEAIAG